ncbi:MAG TPA: hypothetical protein VF352_08630 [Anaerolineales bacterium]
MKRLRLAALFVFGLSIIFYLFFDFCKHAPALGAANPFAEDPYDAVGSFGIQVAFVSALLTLLRAFRPYPQKEATAGQVLILLRSGAVALLSVTVTLAADAIGLGQAVVTNGGFPTAGPLAALVGGMALVTLVTGWVVSRLARGLVVSPASRPWVRAVIISGLAILILAFYPLAWRNSGIPGGIFTALAGMTLLFVPVWGLATAIFPATEFTYKDIFSDLSAIFQAVFQRSGHAAGLLIWMEKLTAFPPVRGLLLLLALKGEHSSTESLGNNWIRVQLITQYPVGWLNPRRHHWNLVILAAVAMGLLLVLVEAVAEGMSPNLGRALLVVGVYVSLEEAGVVLGYLLFGKYLGIFRVE